MKKLIEQLTKRACDEAAIDADDFWRREAAPSVPAGAEPPADSPAGLVSSLVGKRSPAPPSGILVARAIEGLDSGDETGDHGDSHDSKCSRNTTCCGPDVTAWFKDEMQHWMVFAWNMNNLAKSWGRADGTGRIGEKAYQYAVLAILGRQLTYHPSTTFSSRSGQCPANCANTVTLCGGCIHRSELGNLMYGVIARYFQMTWPQTWLGSILGNRGRRTLADAAAVEIGWDFIESGVTSSASLGTCLAGHGEWANMQSDGGGCPPCALSAPRTEPHTTFPALAGLTANGLITVTVPPLVQSP